MAMNQPLNFPTAGRAAEYKKQKRSLGQRISCPACFVTDLFSSFFDG